MVRYDRNKGSGAILNYNKNNYVFTSYHVVPKQLGSPIVHLDLNQGVKQVIAGDGTLQAPDSDLIAIPIENNANNIPTLEHVSTSDIQVGQTVYFGGYPFAESDVHVFSGKISSISKDGKKIKIDGTAVAGMSGGIVAVQRYMKEKRQYVAQIIGFISSETFDPEKNYQNALSRLKIDQENLERRLQLGIRHQQMFAEKIQRGIPGLTDIPKGHFYISNLATDHGLTQNHFLEIWNS